MENSKPIITEYLPSTAALFLIFQLSYKQLWEDVSKKRGKSVSISIIIIVIPLGPLQVLSASVITNFWFLVDEHRGRSFQKGERPSECSYLFFDDGGVNGYPRNSTIRKVFYFEYLSKIWYVLLTFFLAAWEFFGDPGDNLKQNHLVQASKEFNAMAIADRPSWDDLFSLGFWLFLLFCLCEVPRSFPFRLVDNFFSLLILCLYRIQDRSGHFP